MPKARNTRYWKLVRPTFLSVAEINVTASSEPWCRATMTFVCQVPLANGSRALVGRHFTDPTMRINTLGMVRAARRESRVFPTDALGFLLQRRFFVSETIPASMLFANVKNDPCLHIKHTLLLFQPFVCCSKTLWVMSSSL